ncbi:Uu.00g006290.m01.CDS01 [Anthostomella pinea]|uniref:Uu.00g006290.m01.CDS01 n=1 Tax=Anthostomella pinea TaxID=933095 RepID=A0AAI8VKB1_9PEZI|nr:Uu.00g006290.m01.CDS01 [Anthostomella pinea]
MRHFILVDKLDVPMMVDAFIHRVFSLHGAPEFITSDRGSQFVSQFWQRLAERLGSRLKPSSAYHPSTNGQTEIMNAVLEQYLRIYISLNQDDWVDHLPLAEFASNNAVSSTTKFSPFFVNYGWNPRLGIEPPLPRPPNLSKDETREWDKADKHAELMKDLLDQLRHNMAQAQEDHELYTNTRRGGAPAYKIGDLVWLSSENIVTQRPSRKLSDKWLGLFAVSRTYKRACALELDGRFNGIFPVFHHSLLRPVKEPRTREQAKINKDSQDDQEGLIIVPDERGRMQRKWIFDKVTNSRMHQKEGLQYYVEWQDGTASWQPARNLQGCHWILYEFHRNNEGKPGPPGWYRKKEALEQRDWHERRTESESESSDSDSEESGENSGESDDNTDFDL